MVGAEPKGPFVHPARASWLPFSAAATSAMSVPAGAHSSRTWQVCHHMPAGATVRTREREPPVELARAVGQQVRQALGVAPLDAAA